MTLLQLQDHLLQTREIRPIGRTVLVGEHACHAMGLALSEDGTLQLWVVHHDPDFRERGGLPHTAQTNRDQLRAVGESKTGVPLSVPVETVTIGNLSFHTGQSESWPCDLDRFEVTTLLTRFLLSGWNPAGIEDQSLHELVLTALSLDGRFDAIPALEPGAPVRLSMREEPRRHLVEQPITLEVGGAYPDKLFFTEQDTGRRRWAQINQVALCDMWAEMEELFADPRMKERASEEALARSRAQLEASLAQQCPRGLCYPAVEYECKAGLTLQFYTRRWLDAPHKPSSHALLFRGEKGRTGRLGLPLKSDLLQDPTPGGTAEVEAELFCCYELFRAEDIVI